MNLRRLIAIVEHGIEGPKYAVEGAMYEHVSQEPGGWKSLNIPVHVFSSVPCDVRWIQAKGWKPVPDDITRESQPRPSLASQLTGQNRRSVARFAALRNPTLCTMKVGGERPWAIAMKRTASEPRFRTQFAVFSGGHGQHSEEIGITSTPPKQHDARSSLSKKDNL